MPIRNADLPALAAHLEAHNTSDGFVPKPVKRRRNLESEMQRALIRWWRSACRGFGVPEVLLFSIPNGFNADAKRGSIMRAEGQRKGAPDLMLAKRSRWFEEAGAGEREVYQVYHALFLELKTPTGRLSPEQEVYHEHLRNAGYRVEVCRSLDECIATITNYLKP